MTKEEYVAKKNEIKSQINKLSKELEFAKDKYIESNSEFKLGQKVKVQYSDGDYELGFIDEICVSDISNSIKYGLVKCKKDGTPSKFSIYAWSNTLESIEGE